MSDIDFEAVKLFVDVVVEESDMLECENVVEVEDVYVSEYEFVSDSVSEDEMDAEWDHESEGETEVEEDVEALLEAVGDTEGEGVRE